MSGKLAAERVVGLIGPVEQDRIHPGWTMEVTPRAITVLFPPSYWDRMARDHEHEIRNLCEAVGNSLRRVLQHEKGHA